MAFLLLLAAAVASIIALVTDNDSLLTISWVLWGLGIALLLLRKLSGRRKFGSLAEAQAEAEAGDPRAMRAVAMLAKINGNTDEAERLLAAAIEAGDVESMWEMGRLVEQRDGLAAGERWFRMAAERGHFFAKRMFRPGHVYNMNGTTPL